MNWTGLAWTAALGLLASAPAFAGEETQALQGVWSGARFSSGTGDTGKGVKLELTITGNHISAKRVPDEKLIAEGDFEVAADGKSIDAVGTTGSYKGKSYLGIFQVSGDTLTWCTTTTGDAADRPTDFVAEPARKSYLIVVKRQPGA